MKTMLDNFGRVVVPKAVRDDLGLTAGDELDIRVEGGTVVLEPAPGSALARKGGVLVHMGKAVGDLTDAVERMRHEREQTILGGWKPK